MAEELKLAVVTPYCGEADDVLSCCLDSVAAQNYRAFRHVLVADGFPNPLVTRRGLHHITLPAAHADGGALARGLGAMAAVAEGYDGVAFLDADNWWRPDHLASLVELHKKTGAGVCTSGRSICRLDGSQMYIDDFESDGQRFADTNCLCVFRAAFDVLPLWATMPLSLGPICDQIVWAAILERGVSRAHTGTPTVSYRTRWAAHYQHIRETPPFNVRYADYTGRAVEAFRRMSPPERAALLRGIGLYRILR
jgi:hypothetical protein